MTGKVVRQRAAGERRGDLSNFGSPYSQNTVMAVLRSWGVLKVWLTNPTGLSLHDGVPVVTRDGGPRYMVLFPDNKWRYACFGGLNGPPSFYCQEEGYDAPNGESAHLMRSLDLAIRDRKLAEETLAVCQEEVASLKQKLAVCMVTPERADRPLE